MKGLIALFINLLIILIFVHAVGSWITQIRESKFYYYIDLLISPLLNPIRSVLKPINGLDLSPLVLLIVLYLIKRALGA